MAMRVTQVVKADRPSKDGRLRVRSGEVPHSRKIAKELKLANENPARQLNVVLKAGTKEEEVDANVIVTDSKPFTWSESLDNTGSPETGVTRFGITMQHANLFDRDHVGGLQFVMSPAHPERVMVVGGNYKIPLYQNGSSLEFFGGYSNVNALVGGLSNFQGGGLLFSARYNYSLERMGAFDPRFVIWSGLAQMGVRTSRILTRSGSAFHIS